MSRSSDRILLLDEIENEEDEEDVYRANGLYKAKRVESSSLEAIDLSGGEDQMLRARSSAQTASISLPENYKTNNDTNDTFTPRDFLEQILNIKNTICTRAFQFLLLYLTFLVNGASFCLFIYSREYFSNVMKISSTLSTDCILVSVFAVFLGILIATFLVNKYERFYLLFVCSIMSAMSLMLIPLVQSFFLLVIFMFIFGLCFGFTITISYKWSMKGAKKFTDYRVEILCIQICLGLFICSCVIFSFVASGDSSLNALAANKTSGNRTIFRRSVDFNFTDFNSTDSNLTTTLTSSTLLTSTTITFTTTTKVHLKKPEIVDGSYLEQSHVTKPQLDNKATTSLPLATTISPPTISYSSAALKSCLFKLSRACSIQLSNCAKKRIFIDFSNFTLNTETTIENRTTDSCRFVYNYPQAITSLNIQTVNETSFSLCAEWLNSSSTINQTEIETLGKNDESLSFLRRSCLKQNDTDLNDLIEPNKQFNSSCFVDARLLNKTPFDLQVEASECDLYSTCEYEGALSTKDTKLTEDVERCLSEEMNRLINVMQTTTSTTSSTTTTTTPTTTSTTTTPTTTTTTTTSTTSTSTTTTSTTTPTTTTTSTTTSTTSTTSTTTNAPTTLNTTKNQTVLNTENYLMNNMNNLLETTTRKLKEFYALYSNANSVQVVYLILGLSYLFVAALHSILLLPVIKYVLCRTSTLLCCRRARKRSTSSANGKPPNGLYFNLNNLTPDGKRSLSLRAPFVETQQKLSKQFISILSSLFLFGGLLANFMLFMNNYLISRLSQDFFYQAEYINKLFYLGLLLGRIVTLICIPIFSQQTQNNNNNKNPDSIFTRRPILAQFKNNLLLFLISISLIIISTLQLYSSHFNDNLKFLMFNKGLQPPLSTTTTTTVVPRTFIASIFISVKFNPSSILVLGFLFPFLLSCMPSLILRMISAQQQHSPGYLTMAHIWAALTLGSFFVSLTLNFFIYYLKTPNVFIYANILLTILIFAALLFCLVLSRSNVKLVSFNELNGRELAMSNKRIQIENDEEEDDEDDDDDLANLRR